MNDELRAKARKIIVDHTYFDHENCNDDCSKKYYEQKNVDDQVDAILALCQEAVREEFKGFINRLESELRGQEIQLNEEEWGTVFLSIKRAREKA